MLESLVCHTSAMSKKVHIVMTFLWLDVRHPSASTCSMLMFHGECLSHWCVRVEYLRYEQNSTYCGDLFMARSPPIFINMFFVDVRFKWRCQGIWSTLYTWCHACDGDVCFFLNVARGFKSHFEIWWTHYYKHCMVCVNLSVCTQTTQCTAVVATKPHKG